MRKKKPVKPEIPNFSTDDELIEWFDQADLAQVELEKAADIQIAKQVSLTLTQPWTSPVSTQGSLGRITANGHLAKSSR